VSTLFVPARRFDRGKSITIRCPRRAYRKGQAAASRGSWTSAWLILANTRTVPCTVRLKKPGTGPDSHRPLIINANQRLRLLTTATPSVFMITDHPRHGAVVCISANTQSRRGQVHAARGAGRGSMLGPGHILRPGARATRAPAIQGHRAARPPLLHVNSISKISASKSSLFTLSYYRVAGSAAQM